MQRVFESFIESLSESVDGQDLERSMSSLLNAFEVSRFAYLSLSSQANSLPRLISNYSLDWTSYYVRQRYEAIDPVIECARRSNEPFRWGRSFGCDMHTRSQRRLLDEAAEFGICSGFTIPIHDRRGGVAALTFAASEDRVALLRMDDRYHRAFQLIATCFHIHVRRTHSDVLLVDGVQLTRRELECLQWAAKGKSAWEIGSILGIKRRTVAFHLDNTRQKLGVRTIAQAVVLLASSNRTSK